MFSTFSIGGWLWHGFWFFCAISALTGGVDGIPVTLLILVIQYFTVYKKLKQKSAELEHLREISSFGMTT